MKPMQLSTVIVIVEKRVREISELLDTTRAMLEQLKKADRLGKGFGEPLMKSTLAKFWPVADAFMAKEESHPDLLTTILNGSKEDQDRAFEEIRKNNPK